MRELREEREKNEGVILVRERPERVRWVSWVEERGREEGGGWGVVQMFSSHSGEREKSGGEEGGEI